MPAQGPDTVAGLLAESFVRLHEEIPALHQRLRDDLAPTKVGIVVTAAPGDPPDAPDAESMTVVFQADRIDVAVGPVTAEVHTDRQTIARVIDAALTLEEAVDQDLLAVVGTVDRVVTLHAALLVYVHGGVRTASFPVLLARFRALLPPA